MILKMDLKVAVLLSFLAGFLLFPLSSDRAQANPLMGYTIHITAPRGKPAVAPPNNAASPTSLPC